MSEAPINNKSRKPTAKKEFSLADYKKSSGLDKAVKFKPRKWLTIKNALGNTAFMDATGFVNGIPLGECIQLQGHTDSGKTSLQFEIAYSCQQNNILPVLL
jgi:RecA/RadA recombinase